MSTIYKKLRPANGSLLKSYPDTFLCKADLIGPARKCHGDPAPTPDASTGSKSPGSASWHEPSNGNARRSFVDTVSRAPLGEVADCGYPQSRRGNQGLRVDLTAFSKPRIAARAGLPWICEARTYPQHDQRTCGPRAFHEAKRSRMVRRTDPHTRPALGQSEMKSELSCASLRVGAAIRFLLAAARVREFNAS